MRGSKHVLPVLLAHVPRHTLCAGWQGSASHTTVVFAVVVVATVGGEAVVATVGAAVVATVDGAAVVATVDGAAVVATVGGAAVVATVGGAAVVRAVVLAVATVTS